LKTAGTKNFVLINRTPENARKIAVDLGLKNAVIAHWRERDEALKGATLLVNCTPLGMTGQPPLDISLSALSKTAAVCDIVYRPLITSLLEEAEQRGHPVVQGLPMLLHQGRLGFRHWFGADPEVTRNLYEEIAACTK
jgi:shikimate dehydrogenase